MSHYSQEQIARKILQIVENNVSQQQEHARQTADAVWRVVSLAEQHKDMIDVQKLKELAVDMLLSVPVNRVGMLQKHTVVLPNDCDLLLKLFSQHENTIGHSAEFFYDRGILTDWFNVDRACSTVGCKQIFTIPHEYDVDGFYCRDCRNSDEFKALPK